MRIDQLVERLHDRARAAGAVGFGVTTSEAFPDVEAELRRRNETGERGKLGFTYLQPDVATNVQMTYPWAQRLVVLAVPYLPAAGSPRPESGTGRIARFATVDHYVALRRVADSVAAMLQEGGHRTAVLSDDNRLVDRAAAVRAGVGWWGKSSLVLVPGAGPWVLLATVVTDAALPPSLPMARSCGTCVACIDACPTGAIVAPGVLDARLCIAHWAQVGGIIPRELRAPMGDRLYGCDDCLDACPPGFRLLERSTAPAGSHSLIGVLGATDTALLRDFGHLYLPKRRPAYLRRNALVAAGNVGGAALFDVVAGYTGHPDPMLRAHAVWALDAIDADRAGPVLAFVAESETDRDVLEELGHVGQAA